MPLPPIPHPDDLRTWRGAVPVSSRYTLGPAGERFFRALKDHARLLGTRCGRCGVTYAPGRLFCERCFGELTDWIEVGPAGTIEAITTVSVGPDGSPLAPPGLLALIRLDGADTVIVHYVSGIGTEAAATGLRVAPVFRPAEQRTGSILDILHFAPA